MKQQYRVPFVLGVMGGIACFLMTVAARKIALIHVTPDVADPHEVGTALHHLRYQFRALGILSTLFGFVSGWLIGDHIMRPFERLRRELIAGSLGAMPAASTAAWSADVHALKSAALRHEAELMRRTQEQARETGDLKQLLNTVSEGLIQLDSAGRIMQANPAALRFLGLPGKIRGQALISLIRHVELRQIIARAAAGESLDATEVTMDDRRLLISATAIPPEDGNGRASAAIAVADLTQLRRLEGVRRDFVANVSHELKTPLTSIHGYAETLLADADVPAETRRPFLEVIHRNAVRLQRIVDDLLDLSRIESGAWNPDLQVIDVGELVQEVWSTCADIARSRAVTLTAIPHGVFVRADPHGLRQVFSNLFDNALRYTSDGGTIEVFTRDANGAGDITIGRVEIAVRDSGIGIPREALGRIFERFYRVDPARSRADGGTGLGLSIVKHTMVGMDGDVTAESEAGKGTTVILTLPRAS
jgi:two-component system, OmpR family, phosphate regulon sensor histidine kinase PhoR